MFLSLTSFKRHEYKTRLKIAQSLLKYLPDVDKPNYGYMVVRNLFWNTLSDEELDRFDTLIDGIWEDTLHNRMGVNINAFEYAPQIKVADFKATDTYVIELPIEQRILRILNLRNKRLKHLQKKFNLTNFIYHCIARNQNDFEIYEFPLQYIDIAKLEFTQQTPDIINFKHENNEYSFDNYRDTLYAYLKCEEPLYRFDLTVHHNPLAPLEELFKPF
jgi:hypothetical protein